jgi:hypothetical protein
MTIAGMACRFGTASILIVLAAFGDCGGKGGLSEDGRPLDPDPIDAGPRPDAAPVSQDPIENTLDYAELPADVIADTQLPVGGPGAVPFSRTIEDPSQLMQAEASIAKDLTGREVVVRIGWGYQFGPPATWMWTDMSGFVAVSDGSIELVRPLRIEDAAAGASRPREDFVAPQTDPRVVRFSSYVGSGSDGLLVRLRRPVVRPVILVVKVGANEHVYLFDRLFDSSKLLTNIDPESHALLVDGRHAPHGDLCYSVAGSLTGSFAIGTGSNPVPGALLGTFTPTTGSPLQVVGDTTQSLLHYGAFNGSIGGTPFAGYWGRHELANGGPVLAAVGADGDALRGVITGGWHPGASSATFNGTLSTRVACTLGAAHDFPLDNPASGGF